MKKYQDRVCCFIDILGFKEIINRTISNDKKGSQKEIRSIIKALEMARSITSMDEPRFIPKSKKVTQFSDSIVISFEATDKEQVVSTLIEILLICMNFLMSGYLLRGGISIGKLIHTNKYLFGPAIIAAYELETNAALFPRIILGEQILNILDEPVEIYESSTDVQWVKDNLVSKDTDDMYYIDYISKFESEVDDITEAQMYISKLREIIIELGKSQKPSLIVKYGWLKNKFNSYIHKMKTDRAHIEELKEQGEIEIVNYILGMTKIP